MKEVWQDALTAVLAVLVMPWLLVNLMQPQTPTQGPQEPAQTTQPPVSAPVRVLDASGAASVMALEEYLVGVVLGEMPADFEFEALKAQAVVARTYTLRTVQTGDKHDGGICTASDCCQAYCDPEDYLSSGGEADDLEKVRIAVEQTTGQVLTYEGELIEAVYFSSSGGRTEDALAVWGSDVPYLQATDSPETAGDSTRTVKMTASEFCEALGIHPTGPCESWLGPVTRTAGGGVDTMVIGGVTFTGIQLRRLLDLRSTAFYMTAVGERITITTRGYGHRVGMSQYGAEAMAVEGYIYSQILAHYYRGTVLEEFVDNGGIFG